KAYRPFPARLVLVDRFGRIALDAGLVIPKGWDLNAVEACLKRMCSPAETRKSVKQERICSLPDRPHPREDVRANRFGQVGPAGQVQGFGQLCPKVGNASQVWGG